MQDDVADQISCVRVWISGSKENLCVLVLSNTRRDPSKGLGIQVQLVQKGGDTKVEMVYPRVEARCGPDWMSERRSDSCLCDETSG